MEKSPKKLRTQKQDRYKLYVCRFSAKGLLTNSKPCAECFRWICIARLLGIFYEVYYTDENEHINSFQYDCIEYIPQDTYF